jgi:hypothetical protein
LEKSVITPVKLVQNLVDAQPTLTRMYTTLSADEMTVDPLFTFNAVLPAVSNVHTANRVIECSADVSVSVAPWRIELPQGGVIRGVGNQSIGTWPAQLAQLPPNFSIVRTGASGTGKVVENNAAAIDDQLTAYNTDVENGTVAMVGTAGAPAAAGRPGVIGGPAGGEGGAGQDSPVAKPDTSGCNFGRGNAPLGATAVAAACVAIVLRRRRR